MGIWYTKKRSRYYKSPSDQGTTNLLLKQVYFVLNNFFGQKDSCQDTTFIKCWSLKLRNLEVRWQFLGYKTKRIYYQWIFFLSNTYILEYDTVQCCFSGKIRRTSTIYMRFSWFLIFSSNLKFNLFKRMLCHRFFRMSNMLREMHVFRSLDGFFFCITTSI